MSTGSPWSVKNVDGEARALAKKAARASGMTLGAWLTHAIARTAASELGADIAQRTAPAIPTIRDNVEAFTSIEQRLDALRRRLDDTIAPIGRAVVTMADRLEAVEKEQERQRRMNAMFADLAPDDED